MFGFDPRFQFVHEDDVIRSILFAFDHDLPGVFNVAGDGLLPWSEVAKLCGKRTIAAAADRHVAADQPVPQHRPGRPARGVPRPAASYGRGVDNRRLKDVGFRYDYTSTEAIEAFIEAVRLRRTVGDSEPTYRYERDVEQFFRHSPAVLRDRG